MDGYSYKTSPNLAYRTPRLARDPSIVAGGMPFEWVQWLRSVVSLKGVLSLVDYEGVWRA